MYPTAPHQSHNRSLYMIKVTSNTCVSYIVYASVRKYNPLDLASDYCITVNSVIFVRGLSLRNFAYAKFRENKTLAQWRDPSSLPFTDMGKSCHSREFFTSQICLLTLFAKIKFSRKFPNLQYLPYRQTHTPYDYFVIAPVCINFALCAL